MVPHNDDVRPVRPAGLLERVQETAEEAIEVLECPARLRAAGSVVVLEAVGQEEVQQQEVGWPVAQQVRRHREGEPILERGELKRLAPRPVAVDGETGVPELGPEWTGAVRLEERLVEELGHAIGQILGRPCLRPAHRRRAQARRGGSIPERLHPHRGLGAIAVVRDEGAASTVEDVVAQNTVPGWTDAGHEGGVARPRDAGEDRPEARRADAAPGHSAQMGEVNGGVVQDDRRQSIDADQGDRAALTLSSHRLSHSEAGGSIPVTARREYRGSEAAWLAAARLPALS